MISKVYRRLRNTCMARLWPRLPDPWSNRTYIGRAWNPHFPHASKHLRKKGHVLRCTVTQRSDQPKAKQPAFVYLLLPPPSSISLPSSHHSVVRYIRVKSPGFQIDRAKLMAAVWKSNKFPTKIWKSNKFPTKIWKSDESPTKIWKFNKFPTKSMMIIVDPC